MVVFNKLLFFFFMLVLCRSGFSMEDQFDYLRNPTGQNSISSYNATFDAKKFAQIGGYMNIQPEFMDRVLNGSSESLEICAGQGQVLEAILKKRNANSDSPSIRYTVVENSGDNVKEINKIYKSNKKEDDWVGCAQKDLVEFLETNLDSKRNKYDQVFGGFALHIFGAPSFIAIVDRLFDVVKDGGYLYLTQHSYEGTSYDEEYIQNVKSGHLLPFWVKGKFWSDAISMTKLLNAFGFQVLKSGLFKDIHVQNSTTTKYLGIIAQKKKEIYDSERVRQYYQASELFVVELDCNKDVSGNKARLSLGARESTYIWRIRDEKVSQDYDALKVHTRKMNTKDLLIEKFDFHQGNQWKVRSLHTFLLQVTLSSEHYLTIYALDLKDDLVSRLLTQKFSFEIDGTYQDDATNKGNSRLIVSASKLKSTLNL